MNKKYILLVQALILLTLAFGCTMKEAEESNTFEVNEENEYLVSEFAKIPIAQVEYIDLTDSNFNDVESILLDIDYYVRSITRYIDRTEWKDNYTERHGEEFEFKIKIGLTQGASQVKGGYKQFVYLPLEIKFNEGLIESNKAPIAHEVTHLIAPYYSSLSLREGLACVIQDEIGKNPSVFNFGQPVDELSRQYLVKENTVDYNDVIDSIGESDIPEHLNLSKMDIETRKAYYILSHSFSKYLIDKYGLEKFMLAYEAEELNEKYIELYDKNLDELRQDWILYILENES